MKSMIIVPTYNEKAGIKKLIEELLDLDDDIQVLVVDDNSPDGTGKLVNEMAEKCDRIHIIHRKNKLGLGSAYIEGFRYALKTGVKYIFEMDGDLSHDPKYIPYFLDKIKEYDVIIGSRYINGISVVDWPMSRLILSYSANIFTRRVTGLKIKDSTSGFKCFRREVLESINLARIKSNGYAFQIELNYACQQNKYRIAEIPIIFHGRYSGTSKMNKAMALEAFFMVWKLFVFFNWDYGLPFSLDY